MMKVSRTREASGRLSRLHALEWRYDGPLPPAALDRLDQTRDELARRQALAGSALWDDLARGVVRRRALARSRNPGLDPDRLAPGAAHALGDYRRRGLACRDGLPRPR